MTRDELIEELQKLPTNEEVKIKVKPEREEHRWRFGMREAFHGEELQIDRIVAYPQPMIYTA